MFVIGIDPHKGSHTAAVLDETEALVGELRVVADRRQRDHLLAFAERFEPRTWAVEAAGGLGSLLAQQLVEAGESVPKVRHRLNPRGNRQLNHALHVAAITQIAHDTPGRVYFERKLGEGKTRKEALRAWKRRISDAVDRQLVADAQP